VNGQQESLFPSQTKETTYSCPFHPGRQCRYTPLDPDPNQEGLTPWERLKRRGLVPGKESGEEEMCRTSS
jgi:hypothetical protein